MRIHSIEVQDLRELMETVGREDQLAQIQVLTEISLRGGKVNLLWQNEGDGVLSLGSEIEIPCRGEYAKIGGALGVTIEEGERYDGALAANAKIQEVGAVAQRAFNAYLEVVIFNDEEI